MKILVFRKKVWAAVGCAAAAIGMLWAVNFPVAVGAAATTRQLPIYSVQQPEGEKRVAISFDAAWGADDTGTLISILDQYQVKTTFFVVGGWVDTYPDEVAALAQAGHEVMNHSDTHPYMTQISTSEMMQEISACNEKIAAITGVTPTLLRCPYGDYNDTVINTVRSMGMEPIQWSVDSLDWKDLSAEEITRRVLDQVQPGSIILFHNDAKHTPEALPGILAGLQGQGYTIVPVSQLICQGEYTIDHTGMQIPA